LQTAAYISALYIYNIYFHPLRTYPGPKLFAAYRTPYVYNQLRGRLPLRAKELHDLYGPVVRIAPDELSYITAPAWKDIFGFRPGHSQLPKDLIIFPPLRQGQSADIARSDDANHSRQRRLLSHAFSKKALEEQHSMIISYVDLLVRRLHENAAKPQDLMAWYNWTTFDIIGNLAFGESFSCLEDQRFHPWVKTILVSINGGVAISAARRYGLGNLLVRLIPKSTIEKFELLHSYAKEKIARRLERGTERPDFMSHMMRNDHDRKEMSQSEIESTAVTIVIAGSETTAALLSGATYHLMMNPKLLRQVSEEVRNAFLSEKDIDCTTVGKLEFLSAVLKESLRIYPPAPSSMPRKVIGKGGDFIDGKWVPPNVSGCVLFVSDIWHGEYITEDWRRLFHSRNVHSETTQLTLNQRTDYCRPFPMGLQPLCFKLPRPRLLPP